MHVAFDVARQLLKENKGGYWALSHDFISGKIGYTGLGHYYHWQYPTVKGATGGQDYEEFYAANPDASFAYGTPMVGPEGKSGTWSYSPAIGAAGMQVISADVSDEKLERILYMTEQWLFDLDNSLLLNNGVQGTHWDMDEERNIYKLNGYNNAEKMHKEAIQIGIVTGGGIDGHFGQGTQQFIDKYFRYPGLSNELFITLPSESIYRPDLEKLRDQYYTEIITGKRSIDAFDEYLEKWYASGGEQLTKEANEWYDTVK